MFDRLRSKEVATISAVLALSLGATACGNDGESHKDASRKSPLPSSDLTIEAQFYSDGMRKITVSGNGGAYEYASILQFCDGRDLVQETNDASNYGQSGISRNIDWSGCTDGVLTPSDFQLRSQTSDNRDSSSK